MPTFVGRSAGLLTQPSTHQAKFRSPVPRNPMLIPGFVEREVSPLHHTHSQGDITNVNAAGLSQLRQLFFTVAAEQVTPARTGTSTYVSCVMEIRDGLGNTVPEWYWFRHYRSDMPAGTSINADALNKFSQNANSGNNVALIGGVNGNDRDAVTHSAKARAVWFWNHNTASTQHLVVHVGGMYAVRAATWTGT